MPSLTNPYIQKGEHGSRGQRYHIDADEGYMHTDFADDRSDYHISFYRVFDQYLDKKYGKELLRVAWGHARSLGATAVTATNIISSESAGAMGSVFGYQYLTGSPTRDQIDELFDLYSSVTINYPIQTSDPLLSDSVEILPGVRQNEKSPIYRYWNNRQIK